MSEITLETLAEKYAQILDCPFECNGGWAEILDELFGKILALNPPSKDIFSIDQVKEKFGSLRVYFSYSPGFPETLAESIRELIFKAEESSKVTCEWCGEPGKLDRSHGWLLTLCPECKRKRHENPR